MHYYQLDEHIKHLEDLSKRLDNKDYNPYLDSFILKETITYLKENIKVREEKSSALVENLMDFLAPEIEELINTKLRNLQVK